MILLAIDCSASLCAACVFDAGAGVELGRSVLDLGKGHAEHLVTVVEEALAKSAMTYADLDAIAVSTGPGSFTGIRVAVSAARGYALALGVPAIGVNALEALAAEARATLGATPVTVALGMGQDVIQFAAYDEAGAEIHAPAVFSIEQAAALARELGAPLTGAAAPRLVERTGHALPLVSEAATADIGIYARLAAAKELGGPKPSPLYMREPDAKPQAGFVLPRA